MQIYPHIQPLSPAPQHGCALAMGYFDGLHVGHRAVVQAAVDWAAQHGAEPALFTFALPRVNSLKGRRLMSTDDKHAAAAALGVRHYVVPDFDAIKGQSPEEFVDQMIDTLGARALFCGDNFTFGARAAGNVELLRRLCAPRGVEVVVVPMAQYQGGAVSSTRIRMALEAGDIPAANAMLGQPYAIHFPVQHGKGLGHRLGVPTINQVYPEGFQMPKQGIYITRVLLDGQWHPAATGLSSRPTVNDDAALITCETFIPDYAGDLYGTEPRLEFYRYLSPIQKFDTLAELKACIEDAARQAQDFFAQGGPSA